MKVLYAVQGTGNGHISRAREFIPLLKNSVELDVLISGTSAEVDPGYSVKYRYPGISYTFGKNGGVDYLDTLLNFKPTDFLNSVMNLDVSQYDLILNDYEPVTAWACKKSGIECIGLSHQAAFLSPLSPRPEVKNPATEWLFKNYAPVTRAFGFHYKSYDSFISTPVIRKEVRDLKPLSTKNITVYLPSYGDEMLIPFFAKFTHYTWTVFSKHSKREFEISNVKVIPVNNDRYLRSLEMSEGLLCGAGFEAPAEALYLGKRLMVVPMSGQYEQHCNAEALKQMGVTVCYRIDDTFTEKLEYWLSGPISEAIKFPDESQQIIEKILSDVSLRTPLSSK